MLDTVRRINAWFRSATRADVDTLLSKIILSDRQQMIFDMFYIRKQNIGYIADSLNVCSLVVSKELNVIRNKIIRII